MNAYNEADLKLLERIANQVSIAIENSRLYASAQQELAERQKAEEQLRDAEAKYRQLLERVPAVLYNAETGISGRWFYVSPQIEVLLGFTPEEWTTDPNLWYQQIHPEDRKNATTSEMQLIDSGSSIEIEYRMFTKDGQIKWIHDESINISVLEERKYIVQGLLTDVTVRKPAAVEPFIAAMAREMSRADLSVCRAGATTLAELCPVGRAAILIPLPTATDDHQRKNAEVLVGAGAAELVEQRTLTGPGLASRLLALAGDPARRAGMAAAARSLARPSAARVIVDRMLELVER